MGDGVVRLDDLAVKRPSEGPFVSAERLPIVSTGASTATSSSIFN
jgi:hypothetical protein